MRKYNLAAIAGDIATRGIITDADAALLRLNIFDGGEVWPQEIRALFSLMQKRLPACPEWNELIIQAIGEYVINGLEPKGVIDEKNARWLCAMIKQSQHGLCNDDLHLMVAIMEMAGAAPLFLQHFALDMARSIRVSGRVDGAGHESAATAADAGGRNSVEEAA